LVIGCDCFGVGYGRGVVVLMQGLNGDAVVLRRGERWEVIGVGCSWKEKGKMVVSDWW
jgi:hypothetical protein